MADAGSPCSTSAPQTSATKAAHLGSGASNPGAISAGACCASAGEARETAVRNSCAAARIWTSGAAFPAAWRRDCAARASGDGFMARWISGSGKQRSEGRAFVDGGALRPALVAVDQRHIVDPHQVEDRGVKIAHVQAVLDGPQSQ